MVTRVGRNRPADGVLPRLGVDEQRIELRIGEERAPYTCRADQPPCRPAAVPTSRRAGQPPCRPAAEPATRRGRRSSPSTRRCSATSRSGIGRQGAQVLVNDLQVPVVIGEHDGHADPARLTLPAQLDGGREDPP
jgi:hypothetical protein